MDVIRILIAEDQPLVRKGTAAILSQFPDFSVAGEAENGERALEMAKELQPDILLSDMRMPVLNGIELLHRLPEHSPRTKTIILSAYDDFDYVIPVLKLGASAYLLKTIDLKDLAEAIRLVHVGQMVIHPSVASMIVQALAKSNRSGSRADLLSNRESDVLRLLAGGLNNRQIAVELKLSQRTIEANVARIYPKLAVSGRNEAITYAREMLGMGVNPERADKHR
jgi:DNA-binding NarL/FixJ family response regulator